MFAQLKDKANLRNPLTLSIRSIIVFHTMYCIILFNALHLQTKVENTLKY